MTSERPARVANICCGHRACQQEVRDLIAAAEKRGAEKAKDPRWDTAVDWLLNHGSVATDWAPLFFAYYDELITEKELREEVSCDPADTDEDGLPVGIHQVIGKRRAAAEAVPA